MALVLSALSFTISALYQQSSSMARQLEPTTGITKPGGADWAKERMVMNSSKQEEGQLYDFSGVSRKQIPTTVVLLTGRTPRDIVVPAGTICSAAGSAFIGSAADLAFDLGWFRHRLYFGLS